MGASGIHPAMMPERSAVWIEASATMTPTERSKPPATITNICPIEATERNRGVPQDVDDVEGIEKTRLNERGPGGRKDDEQDDHAAASENRGQTGPRAAHQAAVLDPAAELDCFLPKKQARIAASVLFSPDSSSTIAPSCIT